MGFLTSFSPLPLAFSHYFSKAKKGAFLRDKINDFRQLEGSGPNALLSAPSEIKGENLCVLF